MSDERRPDDLQSLWQSQEVAPVDLDLDALRRRAEKLARTLRWRNLREWAACAVLVPAFGLLALTQRNAPLVQLGSLLSVAGVLYVAWRLARDGRPLPAPAEADTAAHLAALRANLERQRALLWAVPRWYLAPLAPGLLVFVLGTTLEQGRPGPGRWGGAALTLALGGLVFGWVAWLNRRAARALGRELEALSR